MCAVEQTFLDASSRRPRQFFRIFTRIFPRKTLQGFFSKSDSNIMGHAGIAVRDEAVRRRRPRLPCRPSRRGRGSGIHTSLYSAKRGKVQLASKEVELDDARAGHVFHNDGVWYRVVAEMVNRGQRPCFGLERTGSTSSWSSPPSR